MNSLLIAPLAFPFAGAVVALLFPRPRLQAVVAIAAALGQLAAAVALLVVVEREGVQALQVGAWAAPFGISLVADRLGAVMAVFGAVLGVACTWYAALTVEGARVERGYFVLTNVLLLGVAGSFLTGDLFNLYVWFEVMLIASFVLLALGGSRPQVEGAVKYVTLNLVASMLLLAGAGLIYALTGTLNMADLSLRLGETEPGGLVDAVAVLLLIAFGIKAAVFPLFSWLPASYHTPPGDVSAFFSGLLTKVGVYAIIRTVTLILPEGSGPPGGLILAVAGLTMVTGVLGALAQLDLRRLLSFHIVSQIGYMLMGLGLLTPLGLAAAIFYMTQHMVTKTALFLAAAVIERERGTGWLEHMGGLYRSRPEIAAVFGLAALSLAGIPPFAGFVAKFALARAGLELEAFAIVAVALAVSLLTLLSMSKIWLAVFWQPAEEASPPALPASCGTRERSLILPAAGLAALSVALGLAGGPYLELMQRTAEEALDGSAYVAAVLGARE